MTDDTERVNKYLEQFSNTNILVIGDVMLDKFIWGDVTRISPEAPVPVVHVKNETCAPGGAANVAMNVATLGAKCFIAGLTGDDAGRDIMITLLRSKNIDTAGLIIHNHPTIQKVRIMGNNHQLVRYDYEEKIQNKKHQELIHYIKSIIENVDVIIISDYAKGTITDELMNEIKKLEKEIIVDPKPQNFNLYKDVFLIKPNEKEAREITLNPNNGEEAINEIGNKLTEQSNAHILISRGKDGMSLFELEGAITHIPAHTREAHDVTGAGDTVVAVMAVALAAGANIKEAAILANHAAGIKVTKIGTVPVTKTELAARLRAGNNKLKTKKTLIETITELKKQNKKIVFTNGCFDILHIGHTRLLQQAKALGDVLILALDTDASVAKLKGPTRPIIPQHERAEILSALDVVDYMIFFESEELADIIKEIQPDYLVKGGDYSKETVVGNYIVEEYGGNVVLIPLVANKSTTNIIQKVKETFQQQT